MKLIAIIFCCCFLPSFVRAQFPVKSDSTVDLQEYLCFDTTESLSFLLTLFPPFLLQYGIELKQFIRSDTFQKIRESMSEVKSVDAIYVRAMQLTHNNTGIALLLSTLATFDHRILQFNVPIFSFAIPLSDESGEEFTRRVNNLPIHLFSDSPNNRYGDRDKLQHFFGSAFITFAFESRGLAERIGLAIEHGERSIIIGGALDDRDMHVNTYGQQFGTALIDNPYRYPSEFLLQTPILMDSVSIHYNKELNNADNSCR